MADLVLVRNILDDSSGADSEDSVQDITNETECPATPKGTTSAASTHSTVTSGSISTPSTTDIDNKPTSSELSRKRKVNRNPPPKGKKCSRGASASDPKSVTPSQRVSEAVYR